MKSKTTPNVNSFWKKFIEAMFPANFEKEQEPDEPYIISRVLHFRSRYIPLRNLKK